MLNGARAGSTEVTAHGTGEQFGGSFQAFGGRHRRLAGARLWGGWADQGECSGFGIRGSGPLPGISPPMSQFHELTVLDTIASRFTVLRSNWSHHGHGVRTAGLLSAHDSRHCHRVRTL